MNKLALKLPQSVTRTAGKAVFLNKKHAPTTLFGVGVAGMIATTVLAARQTLKAREIIEIAKDDLEAVKLATEIAEKKAANGEESSYSEEDRKKDVTYVYIKTGIDLVKLYAPVVLIGVFSIAALTKSHFILKDRNAGLAAAYAVLDKAFSEYRTRVEKELGKDADDHYRYGGEIVDEKEEKDGKVVHVKKFRANKHTPSGYARFFDELCPNWQRQPEYNLIFLRCQQNYANDLLQSRGYVLLNEVYERLGLEHTGAGSVVGWTIGSRGDNYIDFGIFNGDNDRARDFVNGREGAILLDFNVDGVIYDQIDDINHLRRR